MQEREAGEVAHVFCGLGGRRQFITSAQLLSVNCLGCWKFTFYTTPSAALVLMKVTAVKLMWGIILEWEQKGSWEEQQTGRWRVGVEVWASLKQQKDCWSCFHTSRALVTGKLLHSAPSAVLLVCVCECVCIWLSTGNENTPRCCCSIKQGHFATWMLRTSAHRLHTRYTRNLCVHR